jgi:hypothetical protein
MERQRGGEPEGRKVGATEESDRGQNDRGAGRQRDGGLGAAVPRQRLGDKSLHLLSRVGRAENRRTGGRRAGGSRGEERQNDRATERQIDGGAVAGGADPDRRSGLQGPEGGARERRREGRTVARGMRPDRPGGEAGEGAGHTGS